MNARRSDRKHDTPVITKGEKLVPIGTTFGSPLPCDLEVCAPEPIGAADIFAALPEDLKAPDGEATDASFQAMHAHLLNSSREINRVTPSWLMQGLAMHEIIRLKLYRKSKPGHRSLAAYLGSLDDHPDQMLSRGYARKLAIAASTWRDLFKAGVRNLPMTVSGMLALEQIPSGATKADVLSKLSMIDEAPTVAAILLHAGVVAPSEGPSETEAECRRAFQRAFTATAKETQHLSYTGQLQVMAWFVTEFCPLVSDHFGGAVLPFFPIRCAHGIEPNQE